MFITMDVVNREATILTDEKNRKVQGFKASVEKQIVNLTNLSVAKKTSIKEYYPDPEYTTYPTDTTQLLDKELTLLIFNNGNVSSQILVCSSFEEVEKTLTKAKK